MQIALGAALVFAVLWFVALRPKEPAIEPVAATPAAPTTPTPRSNAGGESAVTGIGKTVETAKDGAASADAAVHARENITGEENNTSAAGTPTPAATPSTAAPSAATAAARQAAAAAAATTPGAPVTGGAAKPAAKKSSSSPAQDRADAVIVAIKKDLAKRRAVVVLIWSKTGKEDKLLHTRVKSKISRRGGRVRTYFINVNEVGRYDGLLSGLAVGQTPSTIVIAPNNEAKVLGGLTSTERIDRLTSSALQIKPVATK